MTPASGPIRISLPATLLRSLRRRSIDSATGRLQVLPGDLQREYREDRPGRLIVFLIDASDSMEEGARARMAAAKGAVLALLRQAHWSRDRIGLVSAGGDRAQVILRPTRSEDLARRQLRQLPTGGATPLAAGLVECWKLARQERLRHPGCPTLLVLLSDGEANVPLVPGRDVRRELLALTRGLVRNQVSGLVIASGGQAEGFSLLRSMAEGWDAPFLAFSEPRARELTEAVVDAVNS